MVINTSNVIWDESAARMTDSVYKILFNKRELKQFLKPLGIDWRIILKYIFFNYIMNACRSSEIRKSEVGESAVVNKIISTSNFMKR